MLGAAAVADSRGVAFDAQGRLLALVGKQLQRYTIAVHAAHASLSRPTTLVAQGLDDPQQIALDAEGNLYVSDRGGSHQVKVFSPKGEALARSAGRASRRPGRTTRCT